MTVNLSIKGVPQAVAEKLRARAERNHRSLQGELMAIIERAATEEGAAQPATFGRFETAFVQRGSKTIDEIAAEARALPSRSSADVPLAVDIIRADRDSR